MNKNTKVSLGMIASGVGIMGLAGVLAADYAPWSIWYRSMVAAETSAFAWAGYNYTGPFTNRTDQVAAGVRTMEALEALAAVPISSVMASYGTNYTTNFLYGYVSNYVVLHGDNDTNWAAASFGSLTVTNTATVGNLLLSAPRWVDSMSPAASWISGGTALSWDTNYCGYQIQKGDVGFGSIQLNHDTVTGVATIYPHIHFVKTGFEGAASANTNIVLSFAYRSASIGSQFGTWQEYTVTNGVNIFATNIGTHNILAVPATGLSITGGISKVFSFRVARINKADDNYSAGDIIFTHVDVHYPINTIGSSGPGTK